MSTLQREDIHELVEKEIINGNLIYGDTLFSEQEIDYISYILDSKRFSNGLRIRNSIVHEGLSRKKKVNIKNIIWNYSLYFFCIHSRLMKN